MEKVKKILIITIIMFFISLIMVFSLGYAKKVQYLKNLDYQVKMNNDGSMDVTETWDIDIIRTNTLVRNFNLSKSKFGEIKNVQVTDLQTGKKFEEIYSEMYHVPEGKFYALNLNTSNFEIAFGIGMENKSGNRKIQISYTVEDVVTDYKDCQEIYWKFLAEGQNSIPAKKVTGKLKLPNKVQNLDNLKVWGHGQLNGKIEKLNNSEVYFEMDNLSPGAMFEIRVVTKDKLFATSINKMRNYNYLQNILSEEQKWSEESNYFANIFKTFIIVVFSIYGIILLIRVIKVVRLVKLGKQKSKENNFSEFKYFRDIPREKDSTPAEALYLYKFDKKRLNTDTIQSNAVSATILNLCYKKKITLKLDEKENVYIKIISDEKDLKNDELEIYKLLLKASKGKEEFEIKELNKFAKRKYNEYSTSIYNFVNSARNSLYKLGLIDKRKEKLYAKCENADI